MSSQSPVTPDGAKSEEPAAEEMVTEEPAVKAESSNATSTVLSNELLKIMKGIVDYLTEYKDETYVVVFTNSCLSQMDLAISLTPSQWP